MKGDIIIQASLGLLMAVFDVLIAPNPKLNQVAFEVDKVDTSSLKRSLILQKLLKERRKIGNL